eukprot:2547853-Alexandrium_andersonii.AAC.1
MTRASPKVTARCTAVLRGLWAREPRAVAAALAPTRALRCTSRPRAQLRAGAERPGSQPAPMGRLQ